MYLMYVDESGDIGTASGSSDFFILSGIIINEIDWNSTFSSFHEFRKNLYKKYKFSPRHEIHAVQMVNGNKEDNQNLEKNTRFLILRDMIDWIAEQQSISIITVIVKKHKHNSSEEIFEIAWKSLLQRFENTMKNHNFYGNNLSMDKGIIISDETDSDKLRKIQRKMRVINWF